MTNEAVFTTDGGITDFGWLTGLSPLAVIFVFVAVLCYFCRRLRNIPTSWSWPVTVIGVVLYMLIGQPIMHATAQENIVWHFIYGSVVSIFGTFAAWGLHDKAFSSLASKWPIFGFLVSEEVKSDEPKPNP